MAFTLLTPKDTISIRFKVPDGYDAVGCTAYVSRIEYLDGREDEYAFEDENAHAVSCTAEGADKLIAKSAKKGSKAAKAVLLITAGVLGAALLFFGVKELTKYSGVKNVVNDLVNGGDYGEAYMVARDCGSSTLQRVTCSNIITKCLSEHDYETAYVFSTLSGKQSTVFKRVEYEIVNSNPSIIATDALTVLKKLDNDDEFDRTIKNYIKSAEESGHYPEAIAAAGELRSAAERALTRRNLIVDGVCWYSASNDLSGMAKYDKALEFFNYYEADDAESAASYAQEIVNRCLDKGDLAGAIVLSYCFKDSYDGFETDPAEITITPHNLSIANSLDCAYLFLTDEQKRAYHAEKLALSEEVKAINNGAVTGSDVKDAVSVATYENRTAILRKDGTVVHISNGGHNTTADVPKDVKAVQIAVGLTHTVVLKADGTVSAYGKDTCGQGKVGAWRNIVEVAAGRNFTVGLKSDGTLVACGSNKCGQCSVEGYSNVIGIAACDQTAVILFSDGTVALCGDRSMGLGKATTFTNVELIKAGGSTVIAKKTDGTFEKADGCINGTSGDISGWTSTVISDFAVGSQCIAYTDAGGHLTIMGDGAPR